MFSASFTIKQKNTSGQPSSLTKGSVSVRNSDKNIKFDIVFPKREHWEINDSILTKTIGDSITIKTNIGKFDDLSIFNELLTLYKNDYGLKDAGFVISTVSSDTSETVVTWTPPKTFATFISKAITIISSNTLSSVTFFDVDNIEISSTFFTNYKVIRGLPIPSRITSKTQSKKETIYKSIEFDEIHIE
ncbi:MAG: hypothetical protein WAU01_13860 [Saprospiraceae bacterium]